MLWADRKFKLGHGRAFALYVMGYTAGRGWIEYLRIDAVEANDVFGLRLNVWTSIFVFICAAVYFVVVGRRRPGPRGVGLARRPRAATSRAAVDSPRRAGARQSSRRS